ncbi:MAG: hypothetical protein NOF05_17470 [Candidatus Accumulibacter phosphatis]|uniref:Uncharacterized protein n=1 Tax=Candidatus Accumulibacter cognatus TaxID=2954383 RepID=A0A7D5ND09_9PROT|nr:hypothetical protein [Accumulibacter sp.]MCQ1550549.1 hypothetical protein [Candidatus Accumulibacter phosphatis]QLH50148.1 MAG: hypothetical protein HWD57_10440 [Candidatus Accumulibacter cognatus]MBL8400537.1 hypothetical protein [Accumulibacter sp.]MCM8622267.1 hypothetical protein [Accumulibacter sp.]HMW54212.1 hypothetical protein [Accumulibacter sp.]
MLRRTKKVHEIASLAPKRGTRCSCTTARQIGITNQNQSNIHAHQLNLSCFSLNVRPAASHDFLSGISKA